MAGDRPGLPHPQVSVESPVTVHSGWLSLSSGLVPREASSVKAPHISEPPWGQAWHQRCPPGPVMEEELWDISSS